MRQFDQNFENENITCNFGPNVNPTPFLAFVVSNLGSPNMRLEEPMSPVICTSHPGPQLEVFPSIKMSSPIPSNSFVTIPPRVCRNVPNPIVVCPPWARAMCNALVSMTTFCVKAIPHFCPQAHSLEPQGLESQFTKVLLKHHHCLFPRLKRLSLILHILPQPHLRTLGFI